VEAVINAEIHANLPLPEPLSYRQILKTWWPLAFSWLLMSVEIPAISAVIARLANPQIHLAAFGGIVYPLSLIIESPVIMLLGASVALSKDYPSYRRIWQYMMGAGAILTVVHALVAFTPLYYVVVRDLLGVPEAIVEPARLGMMIMLPWTWSIGYRRFQQGVLIRYGYSGAVGAGTIIRLSADALVLGIGYTFHSLPGSVVGAATLAVGVICEAAFAGWRVRPVLRQDLPRQPQGDPLTWRGFADFYIPLALTSLISLLWQPVGSAAISRMPNALSSLAAWSVVSGLVFLLRSFGIAYNEAVVALLDRPRSWYRLKRFTTIMAVLTVSFHFLIAATPLARFYFSRLSALPPNLVVLALLAFWIALPMPGLAVLQNWFQGSLLYGKRTRGVPESVAIFFVTVLIVLGAGVLQNRWIGLYVAMAGFVLANFTQMAWLWFRSRPVMTMLAERDAAVSQAAGGLTEPAPAGLYSKEINLSEKE
jgi:hypothetical protein